MATFIFWRRILPVFLAITSAMVWITAAVLQWTLSATLVIVLPIIHLFSMVSIFFDFSVNGYAYDDEKFYSESSYDDSHNEDDESDTGALKTKQLGWCRRRYLNEIKQETLSDVDDKLRPSPLSIIFILAPTVSFILILAVHLIAGEDHFDGNAPALDFGPRHGNIDEEHNIAFQNDSISYAHFLQGMFSSFLAYPALTIQISFCLGGCCGREGMLLLAEVISSSMTIYPVYNFVTRDFTDFDTFATSSYACNTIEWALGAVLGISIGLFTTGMIKRNIVNQLVEGDAIFGFFRDDHPSPLINFLRICVGLPFVLSMFGAAFLIGSTWNECVQGSKDCINYSDDNMPLHITAALIAIPVYIWFVNAVKEIGNEESQDKQPADSKKRANEEYMS